MDYITYIRSKVGRQKIFMVYVAIVLRNEQDHILLQRRTDFDVWGLPGGCLELGEELEARARRELLEETGLTAGPLSLLGVYTEPEFCVVYPNGDQVQQYTICLQGKMTGGEMQIDGKETSELRFYAPQELPFGELFPWYKAMLQDALHGRAPSFSPPQTATQIIPQIETMRALLGKDLFIGVGAVGVVQRQDGRILMTYRTDDGFWDFPGGYMNLGENVAHTVVREIREETGLHIHPERILGVFAPPKPWVYPNGDQVRGVAVYFHCQPLSQEAHPDLREISQVAWMTLPEILRLPFPANFCPLIKAVAACLEDGVFVL